MFGLRGYQKGKLVVKWGQQVDTSNVVKYEELLQQILYSWPKVNN